MLITRKHWGKSKKDIIMMIIIIIIIIIIMDNAVVLESGYGIIGRGVGVRFSTG
jgi:accessory gene regulator protein AgrB